MSRSFRFHLAVRFTAAMTVTAATIGAASLLGLRAMLDRELNGTILNVATIQAASVTDSPEMHFHEWELTPGEAGSVRELIRYVQVWDMSGRSLLRSQFMTGDLPVDRDAVSQAAAGGFIWREQSFDGIPVRSIYYSLARFGPAHERHVLQVAAPLLARHQMVERLALFFAGVTLLVAACEANRTRISSSSAVNASPSSLSARKKCPRCSPRWCIGVPCSVFAPHGFEGRPSEPR